MSRPSAALATAVVTLGLVASPGTASATLIDFSTIPGGGATSAGQSITDQYASLGVTIASQQGLVLSNASISNFGAAAGLADAAFANVSELKQLSGMTHAVYDRIRPFVTVYSKYPNVNPSTASREVLVAVPEVSPQAVDFYIAAREAQAAGQPVSIMPSLGATAAKYLSDVDVSAVTITAEAVTDTGVSLSREAIVGLDRSSSVPFKFLDWGLSVVAADSVPVNE